jgi:hypothetical protein
LDACPELKSFISVLKWSLLSNGNISLDEVSFNSDDFENLIQSNIPVHIRSDETADFLVPIILQLEGPPGNFILDF